VAQGPIGAPMPPGATSGPFLAAYPILHLGGRGPAFCAAPGGSRSQPRTTFMRQKHHTAVLVGCSGGTPGDAPATANLASRLRFELDELGVRSEAEFADPASAIEALLATVQEPRVFLVQVKSPLDLPELKRLSDLFTGQPIVALVDAAANPSLFLGANRH